MQNRRTFLTRTTLAAGAFTFLKPLQSLAGTSESSSGNKLTLLYTSGLSEQWNSIDGLGGLNAVADAVARIRRENANLLLLDTGNVLSADSKRNISHLHFFEALRKTGFDLITPGANDLQHGVDYFSKLVNTSRLKTVATNYAEQGILKDAVLPYQVVRKGKLKIGVVGIGSHKMDGLSRLSFKQLTDCINKTAGSLKEKHNCNLVICLSHLPLRNERKKVDNIRLSEASLNVDIFISASSGQFTYNTHVVKNQAAQDVFITHAAQKGTMIGRIDVTVNDLGEKTNLTTAQVFTDPRLNATAVLKKQGATLA